MLSLLLAQMESPLVFLRIAFHAVRDGQWFGAAAAALVALVVGLRVFGRKLHELIPDDHPADRVLWFLLESKLGMWVVTWLSAISSGLTLALLSDGPGAINLALVIATLKVATPGALIWTGLELAWDWWKARKAGLAAVQDITKP